MAAGKPKAIQLSGDESARLTTFLVQGIAAAHQTTSARRTAADECRKLLQYRQPRVNPPWPGASEIAVPIVKQARFSLMSYLVPTLLGPDPMLHYEGVTRDGKRYADDFEEFVEAQGSRYIETREKLARWFDAAVIDSESIIHVYWRTRQRAVTRFEQATKDVLNERGEVVQSAGSFKEVTRDETVYDAPDIDIIPLHKFGTFPYANADVDTSPGVYYRAPMTGEQLLDAVRRGDLDRDAVRAVIHRQGDSQAEATPSDDAREIDKSAGAVGTQPAQSSSYEITQVYYRYADPNDPESPTKDYLITLHEDSLTMLGARASPWFHGLRPFVRVCPYPDPEGASGDTLAETGAGHVQVAQTGLIRLAFDASAIGVLPPTFVGKSLGNAIPTIQAGRKPGGVIPIADSFFDGGVASRLQPFQTGGFSPNSLFPLIEKLDRIQEQSTGTIDDLKSYGAPGNMTAMEASIISESSQKRIGLIVDHFAQGMKRYGKLIAELNYQFQSNIGPQQLWAELHDGEDRATMNEQGQPVPQPTFYDVVSERYLVTSSGIRDTQNRAILAQRGDELLTILSKDMTVWSNPDTRYTVLHYVLHTKGVPDPERYLGTLDTYKQRDAQGQQAQAEQAKMQAELERYARSKMPEQDTDPRALLEVAEAKSLGDAMGKAMGPILAGKLADQLPSIIPDVSEGELGLLRELTTELGRESPLGPTQPQPAPGMPGMRDMMEGTPYA